MRTRTPGLLAVMALAACASDVHDRSAARLPSAPGDDAGDPLGASARRRPRPVVTSIVRDRSHAELYGDVMSGTGQHLCGSQHCVSARADGACGPSVFLDCTCLAGLYAEVHTGPGSGDCTVTIRVRDQEGLEGDGSVTFPVRN
jgi:hypothetical protein